MDSGWRPDFWAKVRNGYFMKANGRHRKRQLDYEAGADAMLTALFELAACSPTGRFELTIGIDGVKEKPITEKTEQTLHHPTEWGTVGNYSPDDNQDGTCRWWGEKDKMKLTCRLGLHRWGEWYPHPHRGDWLTRCCLNCYRMEDRR